MSASDAHKVNPLYAIIDLGSNSFHMLITRQLADGMQVVKKLKQKVRLASGLNNQHILSNEAIERGLACICNFAKHLDNIPSENIRIAATATLRLAENRDEFLSPANELLPKAITLLSGEQEASTIYSGVAHTSMHTQQQKRLVIDIGGASTELIVGKDYHAEHALSLNLGCVSFRKKFFKDDLLTSANFVSAIQAANQIIQPISQEFITRGWQSVMGSSGTMQALAEILEYRQLPPVINMQFLQEIKQALIDFKTVENINFSGLRTDRSAVLASGLSILIALFSCLQIDNLTLSQGALREGLLFEMIPRGTKLLP